MKKKSKRKKKERREANENELIPVEPPNMTGPVPETVMPRPESKPAKHHR